MVPFIMFHVVHHLLVGLLIQIPLYGISVRVIVKCIIQENSLHVVSKVILSFDYLLKLSTRLQDLVQDLLASLDCIMQIRGIR